MSNDQVFFQLYLAGKALPDEIHDFIDKWRSLYSNVEDSEIVPLHDFLGLTLDEYEVWIHDENALKSFATARETNKSLRLVLKERYQSPTLAARAEDSRKLAALHEWLVSEHGK
ncbi:MAG: hypothetical protein LCH63_21485 [Candidatus Melainabacteria bacterium]|nr:hypothetical protein [Candidatus Melainabacteria bacterium]